MTPLVIQVETLAKAAQVSNRTLLANRALDGRRIAEKEAKQRSSKNDKGLFAQMKKAKAEV